MVQNLAGRNGDWQCDSAKSIRVRLRRATHTNRMRSRMPHMLMHMPHTGDRDKNGVSGKNLACHAMPPDQQRRRRRRRNTCNTHSIGFVLVVCTNITHIIILDDVPQKTRGGRIWVPLGTKVYLFLFQR